MIIQVDVTLKPGFINIIRDDIDQGDWKVPTGRNKTVWEELKELFSMINDYYDHSQIKINISKNDWSLLNEHYPDYLIRF